jgi:RNA polymerase sigma-70 factor (ECF subfamily)
MSRRENQPGEPSGMEQPGFHARVRARDPQALELVVRHYLPRVLRAALAAGVGATEAEEIAQETMVTFVETANRFEGRSRVGTWVFGILKYKLLESHRRTRRQGDLDDIEAVPETRFDADGAWSRPPRPIDERLFGSEIRAHLQKCLESAPPRQALAFVLRDVERLETEEICKILEVTRTNLGVLLMRARNRLRDCLESRGVRRGTDA